MAQELFVHPPQRSCITLLIQMQIFFKHATGATYPSSGLVFRSHQSEGTHSVVTQITTERTSLQGEDHGHPKNMIRQRVRDEHRAQVADIPKDSAQSAGIVLEGVTRELEEITQLFLKQVEDLNKERHSRQRECYEVAVTRAMVASSVPSTAPPTFMESDTISSAFTRYSDLSVYTYELRVSNGDPTFNYNSASPSSQPVVCLPFSEDTQDYDERNDNENSTQKCSQDLMPLGCTNVDAIATPGIRLVPKSSSSSSLSKATLRANARSPTLSICSPDSLWRCAIWPSPQPLGCTGQPVPRTPSTMPTATITPAKYSQENRSSPFQDASALGRLLTPAAHGSPASHYSNPPCDEFGRLTSASGYNATI